MTNQERASEPLKPYYQDDHVTIYHGDSRDIVPRLAAVHGAFDLLLTDPPYGLRFMGKAWDYSVPGVDLWRVLFDAIKPGAHCLAFAGTRTQHRMAVNIEDAGFEIRDMIAWVYGSGFPKSLDVSKAIDKAAGAEREDLGPHPNWRDAKKSNGQSMNAVPNEAKITAPATPAAQEWSGWGTALKPALEPITVARKPLAGTVAENVLTHRTGALNIDGCRVHSHDSQGYAYTVQRMAPGADQNRTGKTHQDGVAFQGKTSDGRWPANLIHDGSDEVVALFPERDGGAFPAQRTANAIYGGGHGTSTKQNGGARDMADSGSAARFFYCAKADRAERGEHNNHATVKPVDLMQYLIRLALPPGGVLLDPFAGSGTTGVAAIGLGVRAVLIEIDEHHCEIAARRCADATGPLFLPTVGTPPAPSVPTVGNGEPTLFQ